jgi:hypothetical protein
VVGALRARSEQTARELYDLTQGLDRHLSTVECDSSFAASKGVAANFDCYMNQDVHAKVWDTVPLVSTPVWKSR